LPKAPKNADLDLITVIHAADALSFMIGFGGVGYFGEVLDEQATVRIGISEQDLLELAKGLRQTIGQNALDLGCQ
jgi:2'-5' RNA ligase